MSEIKDTTGFQPRMLQRLDVHTERREVGGEIHDCFVKGSGAAPALSEKMMTNLAGSLKGEQSPGTSTDRAAETLLKPMMEHKLWEFQTDDEIASSPCISSDGTVYVGSDDGYLYAAKGGNKVWDFEIGDRISNASPCVGPDGTVYMGSLFVNKLFAVKDGEKVWEFDTHAGINTTPCIGPDGTVHVGCIDRKLYALADKASIEKITGEGDRSRSADDPSKCIEVKEEWIYIDGLKLPVKKSGT